MSSTPPRRKSAPSRKNGAKPFRVGRSKTGLGLFATEEIKKGAFIIEYWGRCVSNRVADDLDNRYLFEVNSRWTIDGSTRRNTARYINHSCRPNAEANIIRRVIKIRAIKSIKPGDEITYNYGSGYFDTYIKPKGCRCAKCLDHKGRKNGAAPSRVTHRSNGKTNGAGHR